MLSRRIVTLNCGGGRRLSADSRRRLLCPLPSLPTARTSPRRTAPRHSALPLRPPRSSRETPPQPSLCASPCHALPCCDVRLALSPSYLSRLAYALASSTLPIVPSRSPSPPHPSSLLYPLFLVPLPPFRLPLRVLVLFFLSSLGMFLPSTVCCRTAFLSFFTPPCPYPLKPLYKSTTLAGSLNHRPHRRRRRRHRRLRRLARVRFFVLTTNTRNDIDRMKKNKDIYIYIYR